MMKTKSSALISLLLVFLSGALVGAFAYRLYNLSVAAAPSAGRRPDPEEARRHMVAEMRDRVKLDAQQVEELQKILDQTRERFHQMRDKMNAEGEAIRNSQAERIKGILRAEQLPLFDQLRAERERDRKQRRPGEKK
jgi:Spy/CpxP family protein refolding chaperone